MGLFNPPPQPPPPPPLPPAANPPLYASGQTFASRAAAGRGGKPRGGTELTGGQGLSAPDTTKPELVSGLDQKTIKALAGTGVA